MTEPATERMIAPYGTWASSIRIDAAVGGQPARRALRSDA